MSSTFTGGRGIPTATPLPGVGVSAADERAARADLRGQIARLEAGLADAFVLAFAMRHPGRVGGVPGPAVAARGPARMLDLGELEIVRDDLDRRLREARAALDVCARAQGRRRAELREMMLAPGHHRSRTISRRELGEPGCGAYRVRPRLGLIGMLMGWWEVKLSSGCPLAPAGPRPPRAEDRRDRRCARC